MSGSRTLSPELLRQLKPYVLGWVTGRISGGSTPSGATAHNEVTLSSDLDDILSVDSNQTLDLTTKTANTVLAGPSSGSAAKPTFRALVADDIPAVVATDPIWNAKGDLAVGTGADTATVLPIGTPGQVLGVGDGTPEWQGGSDRAGKIVAVCGSGPSVYYTLDILTASPSWTAVSGGLSGTRAKQIQLDPSVPGKAFVRVDSASLYRHDNIFAGGNWTEILNKTMIEAATGRTCDSILIGSFDKSIVDGILYANVTTLETYSGTANFDHRFWLFHSHDDGATWTAVQYETGLSVFASFYYVTEWLGLVAGKHVANKVYCSIDNGASAGEVRVCKSTDGGHTISEILYNSSTYCLYGCELTLPIEDNASDDILWVLFRSNGTAGDYPQRTTDGGANWADWGPKEIVDPAFYDPSDSDYVYRHAHTPGVHTYTYRSVDGGDNWSLFSTDPYPANSSMQWLRIWPKGNGTSRHYVVGRIYTGDTSPRMYTSEDSSTWTDRSGDLPGIGLYGVDVLDASGDGALLYVDDGEIKHLSPSADGTYLTLSGGLPAWGANPVIAHVAESDPHTQYATNTEFDDHSARHENGGADEISVAGLSGVLTDKQDADKLQGRTLDNTAPTDGQVVAWDDANSKWKPTSLPALADHDHSGDAGDGGTFDAANLTSGAATDGQVLTADGSGGAAWENAAGGSGSIEIKEIDGTPDVVAVSVIRVTNGTMTDDGGGQVTLDFGSAATDGAAIHDNVASEISAITEKTSPVAADMLVIEDSADSNAKKMIQVGNIPKAPNDYAYLGFGTSAGLSAEVNILAMQLTNEIKGWPTLVGNAIDLDAQAQWWRKLGTPTTAPTSVAVSGESGITVTYRDALKVVADAADEGFYQRWTYADEPRVKAGRKLSAIAAVWVGTAGTAVTMKLVTSEATEVSATATAQAWTVVTCESLTLDGTYVDLQFTADAADTFYVVPLGVNIGEKAVPLKPRGTVFRQTTAALLVNLDGFSNYNNWADVDLTASTSALACEAQFQGVIRETGTSRAWTINIRRNGSAESDENTTALVMHYGPNRVVGHRVCLLDDGQIAEYTMMRQTGTSNPTLARLHMISWREWE